VLEIKHEALGFSAKASIKQSAKRLSPRPLETPGLGSMIQQGDRMFMFQAKLGGF